jgi:toxin-antitoxin system PIN domain toxin
MRYLLDTNVLLGAAFKEAQQHEECLAAVRITLAGRAPWCLSWVNVYEFLRVATHRRVFPNPMPFEQARQQMDSLLNHPAFTMLQETPRHTEVLAEVAKLSGTVSGNFVHDCHIAALMRENDVKSIVTLDTHFRRFGILEVLGPADL